MEKTKHTPGPLPGVEPYVTTRGGVVILNGPFDIDQARRIARLCKAAPEMLIALRDVLELLMNMDEDAPYSNNNRGRRMAAITKLAAAIDKAEGC